MWLQVWQPIADGWLACVGWWLLASLLYVVRVVEAFGIGVACGGQLVPFGWYMHGSA